MAWGGCVGQDRGGICRAGEGRGMCRARQEGICRARVGRQGRAGVCLAE